MSSGRDWRRLGDARRLPHPLVTLSTWRSQPHRVSASSATGRRRDRRGVVVPGVRSRRSPGPSARSTADLLRQRLPAARLPIPPGARAAHHRHRRPAARVSTRAVRQAPRPARPRRLHVDALGRPPSAGDGVRRARQADPLRQAATLRLPARQRQLVPNLRATRRPERTADPADRATRLEHRQGPRSPLRPRITRIVRRTGRTHVSPA